MELYPSATDCVFFNQIRQRVVQFKILRLPNTKKTPVEERKVQFPKQCEYSNQDELAGTNSKTCNNMLHSLECVILERRAVKS